MKSLNQETPSASNKSCPICLTDIAGHRLAILPGCLHGYCLGCILRWSNYKRSCPLCNSLFDSYLSSSSRSSPSLRKHRLFPLLPPPDPSPSFHSRRPVDARRSLRRIREEINATNRRSRPVPRLRSFGRPGSVSSGVIQDRVLKWRASLYNCGLRAVPFEERNLNPNIMMSDRHREKILCRIEPWIRRELQAVLQDPDPTVIIHVATSLYLSSVEKKTMVLSSCPHDEDTFLSPLRTFLGEWTNKFWHELRCFAETSFTMETYDEVVEYRDSDNW